MGESESHTLSSFSNYRKSEDASTNDGKKYKLRLKFDGSCLLEVVRLNGGHFQVRVHVI